MGQLPKQVWRCRVAVQEGMPAWANQGSTCLCNYGAACAASPCCSPTFTLVLFSAPACRSFTLLMSKGYLQAVETLRNRLMASEWELGLRPIALQV